jgi:hypothetical protein
MRLRKRREVTGDTGSEQEIHSRMEGRRRGEARDITSKAKFGR